MKTNLIIIVEEDDPVILERIEREVAEAKVEYRERLGRIKEEKIRAQAEQTRDLRTDVR